MRVTWVEIVSLVGAFIGTVGGTAGAIGGWLSASAARRAADAEQRATEIASAALRLEHDRRHEELAPKSPAAIEAELRQSDQGQEFLVGVITVPKDYRVRAAAAIGDATRSPIALDLVLRAGREYTFQIEHWPSDRTEPRTKEVWFRFWPPVDGDGVVTWVCPCDRTGHGDSDSESGHWEWRVPVSYYDAVASIH